PISQYRERLLIRLMKQPLEYVETGVIVDRDDALGRFRFRLVIHTRKSDPRGIFFVRGPESPTVVLLEWIREGETVFPETAGIDEIRLGIPVLEESRLDCDRVPHSLCIGARAPGKFGGSRGS